ncbi:MAG: hypothetical protein V2J24_15335 [Pseudomonadales bacterium]|jgi:hypothetical protein|nr:hypothetical protein [Pseudomonadales bacterium]
MRGVLSAALVAVLFLVGCTAREADVAAERAAVDLVTGAVLDRPTGPAYLAADERLTAEERQQFAEFL